jgi:hypothetical protein
MARAQDEWVVKKIPGSGVACGVVRYGTTAVLRSALVLKGALQSPPSELLGDGGSESSRGGWYLPGSSSAPDWNHRG